MSDLPDNQTDPNPNDGSSERADESFDHKRFLASVTSGSGVYQMYDGASKPLYVGKAKNLKKRLASYFRETGLTVKTQALVSRIRHIQVTPTQTETQALVLEQNLIKSQRPPYNILLRDDKSYPYIFMSSNDEFPRVSLHRGAKKRKGRYFGPFPNVSSVRESLGLLQKTFMVRQCEDSVFKNRSRPCLQYQIKRCKAPCVGLVEASEYQADVQYTELFLEGKSQQLQQMLAQEMERAAADLDFEQAAQLRDQIKSLQRIQADRVVEGEHGDMDVFALATSGGNCCIHVLFVRTGRILGSKSYFPQDRLEESDAAVYQASPDRIEKLKNIQSVLGNYQQADGTVIRITAKEGAIYREIYQREPVKLVSEKGGLFHYETNEDLKLNFTNIDKTDQQLTLYLSSQAPSTFYKQADLNLDKTTLNGEFYNDETDTEIIIKHTEGNSYTITKNGRERKAELILKDYLRMMSSYEINAIRDHKNEVISLSVNNSRIKNVIFHKK
jgi:predicted GIY-YIG superfamily endonuclease